MKKFRSLLVVVTVILAVAVYTLGVRPRMAADARLARRVVEEEHPSVDVAVAHRADMSTDLLLPAALQPYQETSIHAQTSGYVGKWLVDIGDTVKSGQTLALIDSPEIDQELGQAKANLEQARANLELARVTDQRWRDLGSRNAVSRQEIDQKSADLTGKEADLRAAQAEVDRLLQLQQFETIAAPFDGIISNRNIDVGTLISAGSGPELFHLAQSQIIRVSIAVPQNYVRDIKTGIGVEILVPEFPNQAFQGKITRYAGALDESTRTLPVEVQIPNPKGDLLAGMFGQIRLRLKKTGAALVIPSNAIIIGGDGARVATVASGNRIAFKKISIGRDFGAQVEVVSGIEDGTRVVSNPSDDLSEGTTVVLGGAPAGSNSHG